MYTNVLNKTQILILEVLSQLPLIRNFYLAGGTALALHYGHRESVDFDFFSEKPFSPDEILGELKKNKIELQFKNANTLGILFQGVTCTFFLYKYPLLGRFHTVFEHVQVVGVSDIAAMKVAAIAGRGKKRDFIDLYFVCQKDYSLREAVELYQKKYEVLNHDLYHVYKGLAYFSDAELDSMPKMFDSVEWSLVKSFFEKQVSQLME
ncbi:MAG: nucleotidyl transferase AbiEii/AbiGii toxin family protein [bacterium]